MAESMLIAHSGSEIVTREQLRALPKPTALGVYHAPIAHVELIEMLEQRLKVTLGATITSEQFSIKRNAAILFGVLNLSYGERSDYSAAIGLRHANDMSLSHQFVCGTHVFVCDNMALRGDTIFLKRKHTFNLDLAQEIDAGLAEFKLQYTALDDRIVHLKSLTLTDDNAKARMLDIFHKGIVPVKYLDKVYDEYLTPSHDEFKPRTLWSLHNAFTETMKLMPMTPRMDATQELGKVFGLIEKT